MAVFEYFRIPYLIALRYYRKLWVRVVFFAVLAVFVAGLAPFAATLLGSEVSVKVGREAVLPVLNILATSMLAVSTFSLNVMVSAHRAAAENATPRSHRVLLENTTTHSVLSVFIGAFVYSLSSIILYQLGFYPDRAGLIVMGVTIFVAIIVVGAMLRWIDHLSHLGSMDYILKTVSQRARDSLIDARRDPNFGAVALDDRVVLPEATYPIASPKSGYIQLLNVESMSRELPEGAVLYVHHIPGEHILEGQPIASLSMRPTEALSLKIVDTFTMGSERSFEQDPEFGLQVLTEIASRALSPGVNDPGTAIQVIDRLAELVWQAAGVAPDEEEPQHTNIFVPLRDPARLVEIAFDPIARDGSGIGEVTTALDRALGALSQTPDARISHASQALKRRKT
ncbi:DUF2254 domain-containing protein [Celeribacter arenosi]|uniref:DUF2254 domain-containing protein n=1 Tax=Celeribacter arenosi TaxID=792649 RepID=A0ABP7K5G7_9RHOB